MHPFQNENDCQEYIYSYQQNNYSKNCQEDSLISITTRTTATCRGRDPSVHVCVYILACIILYIYNCVLHLYNTHLVE
jgi:hypothetical protein